MDIRVKHTITNRLLQKMDRDDLALLLPDLTSVELPPRKLLETANKAVEAIYFVQSGMVSVVANAGKGASIEVGLVGLEGMTGISAITGAMSSPGTTFSQAASVALKIGVTEFQSAVTQSPTLQKFLLLYVHTFLHQVAQNALAHALYTIEERAARWLLMAQDRIGGERIGLTHEVLSVMLGVRRPGVTTALGVLERNGLISVSRGAITILNRSQLSKLAGNSYGIAEAEYARVFG